MVRAEVFYDTVQSGGRKTSTLLVSAAACPRSQVWPHFLDTPQIRLEARNRAFADFSSFLENKDLAKQAGHDADSALDLAYNAEIQTFRADEKVEDSEEQVEAAEGWEEYELSLLALLALTMVGTAGWLYNQYQRWLGLKKAMAEHHNRQ
ncbi:unnamed protein product [Symbiodinium sp. CCMP2592]|nr:unnamed protein product [Symbiodinium sp. CCMP2592]